MFVVMLQEISAASNSEAVASQLPSLYSIKSSLYRSRRESLPPMPRTRADLHLSTVAGENFVIANDRLDDKIVQKKKAIIIIDP